MLGHQFIKPKNQSLLHSIATFLGYHLAEVVFGLFPHFNILVPTRMAELRLAGTVEHDLLRQVLPDNLQNLTQKPECSVVRHTRSHGAERRRTEESHLGGQKSHTRTPEPEKKDKDTQTPYRFLWCKYLYFVIFLNNCVPICVVYVFVWCCCDWEV